MKEVLKKIYKLLELLESKSQISTYLATKDIISVGSVLTAY